MPSVIISKAKKDLTNIINMTLRNHDETVIVSEEGSVVLLEESEWKNIQETLNLLNDKQSLSALISGHAARDAGKTAEGKSVEEIFTNV